MKVDPCCQQQKCRPLTLVSGDIKIVQIFAVVLWRGASNDSGVIENVDFHGFWTLVHYVFGTFGNEANMITQYYFVPCHLSSDPKYMTLNDLDGLFGIKFCFRTGLAG